MSDISEFSDEPGRIWKLTGPNSVATPGRSQTDAELEVEIREAADHLGAPYDDDDDLTEPWMGPKDRGQMRVVIVALPVNDDTDIFDVQERINAAFPTGGDDSLDSVVYESAEALADDLGWEVARH